MSNKPTAQRVSAVFIEALKLIWAKNHDYGDAWKELTISSHFDRIRVKLSRISRLLELRAKGEEAKVSEGVKAEVLDIINYAAFILLALEDQDATQAK